MTTLRSALPIVLVAGLTFGSSSLAQSTPAMPTKASTATTAGVTHRTTGDPRKDTLMRMSKPMTLEVTEARLEDILTFIKDFTQADMEIVWQGDGNEVGLDKEKKLTLNIKLRPALSVLEAVLDKAKSDFGTGNTWQLSPYGPMQVGPREALNKERRVETYDINDLLSIIPRYADVPEIDLNSVLQQSQGGGGGQSPFQDNNRGQQEEVKTRPERAKDIIDILVTNVESEQWTDNGGDAATIRFYGGTLIVNAPDYVHRGIAGYPFWPAYSVSKGSNGRRWLSLNMDTGASRIDGFGSAPVTAVVGGRPISSNPGGGGLKAPPGGGGGGGGGAGGGGGKK